MHKTSVLTTVFLMDPGYLTQMFNSLVAQSFKDFDLIVVNDGFEEFSTFKDRYSNDLSIIEIGGACSPAENRKIGINYCIEKGYDFLVFCDSDDTFSSNRIEHSVEKLQVFDIIVNDLTLFSGCDILEDHYLSNRLVNGQKIHFDFVKNKNIFGLSNTAINLRDINPVAFPGNLIAFDWYFFSVLLLANRKAVFTNETVTYYRQYDGNQVGLKDIDYESFKKGLKVKQDHYRALSLVTNKVTSEYQHYCQSNEAFGCKADLPYPLWWEMI